MRLWIAAALVCIAPSAWAEGLAVHNTRLLCDRDVEVPVVFVTGPEDSVVVMQIEGNQILLYREPAASGAKYSWPSDGASYVLWTKGDETTILWREAGEETQILSCIAQM